MVPRRHGVDHRDRRGFCEAFELLLVERANHDDVDHLGNDARHVFDGFAASELRIASTEKYCVAAELVHSGFERDPGAGAAEL